MEGRLFYYKVAIAVGIDRDIPVRPVVDHNHSVYNFPKHVHELLSLIAIELNWLVGSIFGLADGLSRWQVHNPVNRVWRGVFSKRRTIPLSVSIKVSPDESK